MRLALLGVLAGVAAIMTAATSVAAVPEPARAAATTAWRDGAFRLDVPGIVGRSDVVLGRPNTDPSQAMPLGNGDLGVGVWAAGGFTAQLNRADTMPDRLSPGQLVIPGLSRLTAAKDYRGRLDLYDGRFTESGGGMTATAYVPATADDLVVDVTGADPATTQTAQVNLWSPRTPQAAAAGSVATLAQTWSDTGRPGSSGMASGSLAALTAAGRDVTAKVTDPLTVTTTFRPDRDGRFRVVVAAPHWTGGDAQTTGRRLLVAGLSRGADDGWWHAYWHRVGLMRLSSADGTAQYMENLRLIDLYTAAAERGTDRPGSQAGVADLFDTTQDVHSWDPASYWHWNLRMQVAANIGAGAFENNDSYFRLYRDNLTALGNWTATQVGGRPGICIPETMRFNGVGIQVHLSNGQWGANPYLDCSAASVPNFNARTLTTGAEVSLWIWQQYLVTGDRAFLTQNYPVMAASARFLLAYAQLGADGHLHTYPSNAHETQWDVHDPTTDIAAMKALFPAVVDAAGTLHRDTALVAALRTAIPEIPPYPLTTTAGTTTIADSADPAAALHNVENIGLEPVWPYGLIGDQGPLSDLGRATFAARPNVMTNDWSNDPIQAARLGLAADVENTLVGITEHYQLQPSGLAAFGGSRPEPYAEQAGVVATALQESLVQDYDGLLRIAPAWPSGWDADGVVYIQDHSKVDVQVENGVPVTVAIEAGATGPLRLRSPWPGRRVEVVNGTGTVVSPTTATEFTIPVRAGRSYLVEPVDAPTTSLPFAAVTGTPATTDKTLGPVSIGLPTP